MGVPVRAAATQRVLHTKCQERFLHRRHQMLEYKLQYDHRECDILWARVCTELQRSVVEHVNRCIPCCDLTLRTPLVVVLMWVGPDSERRHVWVSPPREDVECGDDA